TVFHPVKRTPEFMEGSLMSLNLEQQRKRAKDLHRSHRGGNIDAAVRIARHLPRARNQSPGHVLASKLTLSEAQLVIAREAGFSSWPNMKHHIEQFAFSHTDTAAAIIDAAFAGDDNAVESLLARDPEAPRRSIDVAVVVADAEAVFAQLLADPSLTDRRRGNRNWTPLLYLCCSRYRRTDPAASEA